MKFIVDHPASGWPKPTSAGARIRHAYCIAGKICSKVRLVNNSQRSTDFMTKGPILLVNNRKTVKVTHCQIISS